MVINKDGYPELEPHEHYFAFCDCHGEAISIEPDYESPTFYLSFWQRGLDDYRFLTFKQKIRWIWHIIKKDSPFTDQICLSPDNALRMSRYILRHYRKMEEVSASRAEETMKQIDVKIKENKE